MRLASLPILGAVVGAVMLASTGMAFAQSCGQLWHERNAIYKRAGFCFKTSRAIAAFGNAGCSYDSEYELPLSSNQRARVARIVRLEREFGCR